MFCSRRSLWLSFAVLAVTCSGISGGSAQDKPLKPDAAELEKAFAERMSGSVLVGNYSVVGKEMKPSNPERYELRKVAKVKDNLWLFEARIKYGKTDVTLPMHLRLVWADDTPMIHLSDTIIPGLGTFSARVLFHGDRYAGTWQHDKVGGHFGCLRLTHGGLSLIGCGASIAHLPD